MEDLLNGVEKIRTQFRRVAPLVRAHTAVAREEFGDAARVSTCFRIDDYFRPDPNPTEIINKLRAVADECGLQIDYLAREAGCAVVPSYHEGEHVAGADMPLAEVVSRRIVIEPDRGSNGRRPPTDKSGWLCNGRRSPDDEPIQAMRVEPYQPPEESAVVSTRFSSMFNSGTRLSMQTAPK